MSADSFAVLSLDTETLATITGGGGQSESTFKCGPYTLGLKGPDLATAYRNGREVGSWDSDARTPYIADRKGNMSFVDVAQHKAYRCRSITNAVQENK